MSKFTPKITDEIRGTIAERVSVFKTRTDKVRDVAGFLFFTHGIYPSAAVVRDAIGTGSLGDINTDLRGFWADVKERGAVTIDAPMLPEAVSRQFSEALGGIWDLALIQANDTLEAERQELAINAAEWERQIKMAEELRSLAEHRAEKSQQELRDEREKREDAEIHTQALMTENVELRSALSSWQEQAASESEARRIAEDRFSQDLKAEREAKQREVERYEGDIRFCKMEIDHAREAVRDLRSQLNEEKVAREVEKVAFTQEMKVRQTTELEVAVLKSRLEEMAVRLKTLSQERSRGAVRGVSIRKAKTTTSVRKP